MVSAFDVASKSFYWAIAGTVLTVLTLIFAFTISAYISQVTNTPPEIKVNLISSRFVNIPECFAYQENITKAVYPGVIDLDKFTDEQMLKCYKTSDIGGIKTYNFRLKLKNANKEVFTDKYYKVDRDEFTLFRDVLVKTNNDFVKDELIIYVQEKIGT